jgi:ketosteroid isomerase-like protein
MFDGADLGDLARVAQAGWHPDIVYREDPKWPGAGVYEGRDAVVACFLAYGEALEFAPARVLEVTDTGDWIVAVVRFRGVGAGSRVPADHDWAYLIRLQDGRVRELNAYFDPDEARAVAGPAP